MTASIFIPHELCEALASAGRLELDGDELTLTTGRGRYRVREALRVIKEVASGTDAPGLCGTVQLRTHVTDELGAELSQSSSEHIRRDLELMSTLRSVEQGVCSGYLRSRNL